MSKVHTELCLFVFSIFISKAFCNPAEAFFVNINLKEMSPQGGNACTTLDNQAGTYQLIPAALLSPGLVIPANCTIQRLLQYNCNERAKFSTKTKKTKTKTKTSTSSNQGAAVDLKVLILCNACQQTNGAGTSTGTIASNNGQIINQNALQDTFGLGLLQFSVKANEKKKSSRSRRKSHTRSGSGRHGKFLCGDVFIRSTTTTLKCGKLM